MADIIEPIKNDGSTETSKEDVKIELKHSYQNESHEKCWYDGCNCDDVLPGDCDALVNENNKGVGRFACMADNQECYNKNFMKAFLQKIACQFDHVIMNICAIWDMITCMSAYLAKLGDLGTTSAIYLRNSAVSSATFYHDITEAYDLDIYMDSTTGVVQGESDDQRRTLTDRKYRVYIRWCADGTSLNPLEDNTMTFTVYHSEEQYNDEMREKRSIHWQMTGVSDGAMELSDSIIVPAGSYVRLRVEPANQASGTFRVHNFKVEYTPVIDGGELPDCIKPQETVEPCDCAGSTKQK